MPKPVAMLCLYRPKKGKEEAFLSLLRAHWTTLRAEGLASPRRAALFRARDRRGRPVLVETFEWKDETASGRAHATPEVRALWRPMERLADDMDFLELERVRPARGGGSAGARGAARPGARRGGRAPARGAAGAPRRAR